MISTVPTSSYDQRDSTQIDKGLKIKVSHKQECIHFNNKLEQIKRHFRLKCPVFLGNSVKLIFFINFGILSALYIFCDICTVNFSVI